MRMKLNDDLFPVQKIVLAYVCNDWQQCNYNLYMCNYHGYNLYCRLLLQVVCKMVLLGKFLTLLQLHQDRRIASSSNTSNGSHF